MGDDEPAVPERDLTNHVCFTNVENAIDPHLRGTAMGHFYNILSTGDQNDNIEAQGMRKSLDIIRETLYRIGRNIDYEDFMLQSIEVVLDNYGRCSEEFLALTRTWEHICVPVPDRFKNSEGDIIDIECYLTIKRKYGRGDNSICEEEFKDGDGSFTLCAEGTLPTNASYSWHVSGMNSRLFQFYGGTNNRCLNIIGIPIFPYYPQYISFTVYVKSPNNEFWGKEKKIIKFEDCDGDDPTCEEYYNNNSISSIKNSTIDNTENKKNQIKPSNKKSTISTVRVFKLSGKEIYSCNIEQFTWRDIQYDGVVIVCFINKRGKLVESEKRVFFNK